MKLVNAAAPPGLIPPDLKIFFMNKANYEFKFLEEKYSLSSFRVITTDTSNISTTVTTSKILHAHRFTNTGISTLSLFNFRYINAV